MRPFKAQEDLVSNHVHILQLGDNDDPVYQFLDKKRSEGKDYLVYMTAGANKFLRIYYGKVKECLREQQQTTE